MKVLHITTHMNIGGIANYILSLAAALKAEGVECLVASSGGNIEEELKDRGIRHLSINLNTKFEFSPKVFVSAFAVSGIVRHEGIELIHAHTRASQVAAALAGFFTGVPYVTTCHGYFKKRARGVLDTWGEKVVAISDAVALHLERDLGVAKGRIRLIYSGVDAYRFSKQFSEDDISKIRGSVGIKGGPVVGTIGRLSSVKGQRFLVEAMRDVVARVPGTQCLIVGDGEEEAPLKSLAISLGMEDAVRFVRSDPDTRKFLAAMDVFVFPSLKEGLGIALLEALAAGKACVASRVGGIGDIIEDGAHGLLVAPENPRETAAAIIKLLNDPALRKAMGEKGRAVVKDRFSLKAMARKMAELYKEAISFKL